MIDSRALVENCYGRLPEKMRQRPWLYTDHGCGILQHEDELNAYLAAYGEMHILKCSAALQNIPFKELAGGAIEVYDWGCGQGIATIVLMEMLAERGLLGIVRRVTLIEPGEAALKRAQAWVGSRRQSAGMEIRAVNRAIPSTDGALWNDVPCGTYTAISLFSNILDLSSVNLRWLARMVAKTAMHNYVVCVGPLNRKPSRIDDFCNYFAQRREIGGIIERVFQYTTRTRHPYSCEARTFLYHGTDAINLGYREQSQPDDMANDYDYAAKSLDGVLCPGLIDVYMKFRDMAGCKVFVRPSINSATVDMIIAGPSKGVILINECGKISSREELLAAVKQVEEVKDSLFDFHLKSLAILNVENRGYYGSIKTALFFTDNTIEEINAIIDPVVVDSITINRFDSDTAKSFKKIKYLLKLTPANCYDELLKARASVFKSELYEELEKLIVGCWHRYSDGDTNIRLTATQLEKVKSTQTRLRIKGVSGSGKTQVLAARAVEMLLRTGKRVLILTFNKTLVQYIRMRINQVPADFATNMFDVINYHRFFKLQAGGRVKNSSDGWAYDDVDYFENHRLHLPRYHTIIIDEAQDFHPAWFTIIMKYFLADDGTMTVFGDSAQNIYKVECERDTKMPPMSGFTGRWQQLTERVSMRMRNQQIAHLASEFMRTFIDENEGRLQTTFDFEPYYLRYWKAQSASIDVDLAKQVLSLLDRYELDERDTVVLSPNSYFLQVIEQAYEQKRGQHGMMMVETLAQNRLLRQRSNYGAVKDEVRGVLKAHFTTDCPQLKLATIHSFKGWEAKNVILLLTQKKDSTQDESREALYYTGITRARCNLFIINYDEEKFDAFFQREINGR